MLLSSYAYDIMFVDFFYSGLEVGRYNTFAEPAIVFWLLDM